MTHSLPKLSVIIPVFRDTEALRQLLGQLQEMPDPPAEIICVDGEADTECRQACKEAGARYLISEQGRGVQLDTGARAARGNWLWFLHADATPPVNACIAIREALAGGRVGGWFRFRFEATSGCLPRLLAALINCRCRFGTPYGDQGLFMTANAYRAAGGFPDQPLFEEVPLVRALRARGAFRPLALSIGVSPRRWQRDGWWQRSFTNRLLALGYSLGVPPARLARAYARRPERGRLQC